MYVYSYNKTGQVDCLSAMRIPPSKPEQGYTILNEYHGALSETDRDADRNHSFKQLS
jgi:hypothetical protein